MKRDICIVGLGYVGLPILLEFGRKIKVNGYDIDKKRINELKRYYDRNMEFSDEEIKKSNINLTSEKSILSHSDFIIVAIPTPIDKNKNPDLSMIKDSTKTIGSMMKKGSIIVFESTVYPGVTEEVCVPILEKESGLVYKKDFKVGYSPERINPGDKEHTLNKIVKVVSGCDDESLKIITEVYEGIIDAGVHKAPSIKVAEAAKVIENVQRDINIAFMNEIMMIFDKMNIDIDDVLEAAKTKWNFMPFHPGLVGGHCIGIDPYYLAFKAKMVGHHPEMILAGRNINDGMSKYYVNRIAEDMGSKNMKINGTSVIILGATFKPNVKDLRNSKVENIIKLLENMGCKVSIHDPMFEENETIFGYINVKKCDFKKNYDYLVLAVNHKKFSEIKDIDFSL